MWWSNLSKGGFDTEKGIILSGTDTLLPSESIAKVIASLQTSTPPKCD
jgi:hypothetical protein